MNVNLAWPVVLCCLAAVPVQAAEMPARMEQVPLYPGAKPVPPDPYGAPPDPGMAEKEYAVDADLDRVYEFYRKQYPASLPGTFGQTGDNGFGNCARTVTTPAWQEGDHGDATLPDWASDKGYGAERHHTEAQSVALRRQVRGARPGDRWRDSAELNWCSRLDANRFVILNVVLVDNTRYEPGARPKTMLRVQQRVQGVHGGFSGTVEQSQKRHREDNEEVLAAMLQQIDKLPGDPATKAQQKEAMTRMMRAEAQQAGALQNSPAAVDPDIPVYPGALLDTQATAGMGAMGAMMPWKNYVYYSADDLTKVKAFYEQRADRKGAQQSDSRIIVLRQGPDPQVAELTVTLKAASKSDMKTEILFRKLVPR